MSISQMNKVVFSSIATANCDQSSRRPLSNSARRCSHLTLEMSQKPPFARGARPEARKRGPARYEASRNYSLKLFSRLRHVATSSERAVRRASRLYRSEFVQSSGKESPSMTRIGVNYDGWLSLPTAVRQKLGLTTGDQLEVELSDGSITLRPVRSTAEATPAPVATAEPSVPATPSAAAAAAPMVKRGP